MTSLRHLSSPDQILLNSLYLLSLFLKSPNGKKQAGNYDGFPFPNSEIPSNVHCNVSGPRGSKSYSFGDPKIDMRRLFYYKQWSPRSAPKNVIEMTGKKKSVCLKNWFRYILYIVHMTIHKYLRCQRRRGQKTTVHRGNGKNSCRCGEAGGGGV